jgi:hypothetical protein
MKITIELPPALQSRLSEQAASLNISLETLILQTLTQYAQSQRPIGPDLGPEYDPITPMIGTLDIGTTDLGETTSDKP